MSPSTPARPRRYSRRRNHRASTLGMKRSARTGVCVDMPTTTRTTIAVRSDARGVPVTASSTAAVELMEHAVLGFVGHRNDTAQRLERALASDPGLLPALCLQGFAYKALGRTDLVPDARARLRAARESIALRGASERERALTDAL